MSTTGNGKAFEFACVRAMYFRYCGQQKVILLESDAMNTAKKYYDSLEPYQQQIMSVSAEAGIRVIERLEPQLLYPNGNVPLILSLQTDAQGITGDVRDVLCVRKNNQWEIGISCKHNHHAVKHSRLSATIDFGKIWFGIPCSKTYFQAVTPVFSELKEMKERSNNTALWRNLDNKLERYYFPILKAFIEELNRLCEVHTEVPRLLIMYLVGRHDFYKLIAEEGNQLTRIEVLNIYGTLNQPSGKHKPLLQIPVFKMPDKMYEVAFIENKPNTIRIAMNNGWEVSMRIHNASSRIEPSLKFDVQLISMPISAQNIIEPWGDANEKKVAETQKSYGV